MINKNQLSYELGIMMFRAITYDKYEHDSHEYDISLNFKAIVEALEEKLDKDVLRCGFENEYENENGKYNREEIEALFLIAIKTYGIELE